MALDALSVCQGGSCGEWGGQRLIDAASVLASGSAHRELLDVKVTNCCGECPDAVMMRAKASLPSFAAKANDIESALDTAEAAILEATEQPVDATLRAAFIAHETAVAEPTIASLSAAIDAVPADVFEPWQPPL
eukprot:2681998-Prymnesium_polylepis.1